MWPFGNLEIKFAPIILLSNLSNTDIVLDFEQNWKA